MYEDEKVNGFIQELKNHVRIKVLKIQAEFLDECTRITLNVDSVTWRASGLGHENGHCSNGNRYMPTNFRTK